MIPLKCSDYPRVILLALLLVAGCGRDTGNAARDGATPPQLPARAHTYELAGVTIDDPWAWLEGDPDRPEVRSLMAAEQDYLSRVLAPTQALQQEIYREIAARQPVAEQSLPIVLRGYRYYREYRPGFAYPFYLRQQQGAAQAEVFLDVNEVAAGATYFDLRNWALSPDGRWLAFAADTTGNGSYTLHVRSFAQKKTWRYPGVAASMAYSGNSEWLYFVALAEETLRPARVFALAAGQPPDQATQIYAETDPAFHISLAGPHEPTDAVQIVASSPTTSDILLASGLEVQRLLPRRSGDQYQLALNDGNGFLLNHSGIRGNAIYRFNMAMPVAEPFLKPAADCFFVDMALFSSALVIDQKCRGQSSLLIAGKGDEPVRQVAFTGPTTRIVLFANLDRAAGHVRVMREDMATPPVIVDVDLATLAKTERYRTPLPATIKANSYKTERLWFDARDGMQVPISVVYHRERYQRRTSPGLLYGYGAYGLAATTAFPTERLSLLNRGFLFAVVHVRGGGLLGPAWHEAGRHRNKRNSVTDFIDATAFLVQEGWVDADKVFATGVSAGGTLVAAAANQAPHLYRGVVADVPFVDLLGTLSDTHQPLTSSDLIEWGDPRQASDLQALQRLSPYASVRPAAHPNMLVTTGLQDARVGFHEPWKWVARLRENQRGQGVVLIDIASDSGHGGATDADERHRQQARAQAFILHLIKQQL